MFQSPFTSQQRRPPSASRTPFHSLLMLVASLVRAAGPKPGPQLQVPLSPEETLRRTRRKGSYHLIASRNKLPHPDDPEEEEDDMLFQFLTARSLSSETAPDREKVILQAKSDLLRDLASSSGDTLTSGFKRSLEQLVDLYDHRTFDARKVPPPSLSERNKPNADNVSPQLDGMWLTLSVPQFQDCLGFNKDRQLQYTLGRMSFDMFRPGQLICSIQGTFNPIHVMDRSSIQAIKHVPKSLRREVKACNSVIRSYE